MQAESNPKRTWSLQHWLIPNICYIMPSSGSAFSCHLHICSGYIRMSGCAALVSACDQEQFRLTVSLEEEKRIFVVVGILHLKLPDFCLLFSVPSYLSEFATPVVMACFRWGDSCTHFVRLPYALWIFRKFLYVRMLLWFLTFLLICINDYFKWL